MKFVTAGSVSLALACSEAWQGPARVFALRSTQVAGTHLKGTSRRLPLLGGSPLGPAWHSRETVSGRNRTSAHCSSRRCVRGAPHPTCSSGAHRGCSR